jgi:uncharacterized protein YjbJ (UPF0337 family)
VPSYAFGKTTDKSGASEGDMKFLEGKIKKLEEQLKNASDEVRSREAIINRFKEW